MTQFNLPTAEELRSNYVAKYNPFFALISERQAHTVTYNSVNIKSSESIGDVLAKKIGISDTEQKQVISGRKTKTFNKEFLGIKYIVNKKQDMTDYQDIVNGVVNSNLIQFDKEIFQGTNNNGIISSSDSDHEENSPIVAATLNASFAAINTVLIESENANGNGTKTIAPYGAFRTLLNTFNTDQTDTYLNILKRQFPNVKFVEVPSGLVTSETGFVCMSGDYVKLHYTQLPQAINNGENVENGYVWTNVGYGTANVECSAPKAIIVQPITAE